MSITLAEVRAKITELENAISAATVAASYGKGDKQLARQNIRDLQTILHGYRRTERELVAMADGSSSPGFLVASWNQGY